MPAQVISHVRINNADWATTPNIPLNPGLVAIIGARGSGKTALADVIAAGCDAITPAGWDADENISPSFLARARRLIGDATTTLTWGGGTTVTRSLDGSDAKPAWETGSAVEVQAAMTAFIVKYLKDLLSHAPFPPDPRAHTEAAARGLWRELQANRALYSLSRAWILAAFGRRGRK